MNLSYWKKRWEEGHIGWHSDDVDPDLIHFATEQSIPHPNPVLIPLCGKSIDIDWLLKKNFTVEAVDISSIALQAIMARHPNNWTQTTFDQAIQFHIKNLTLWQANFFNWAETQETTYGWAWDRAAFVAIKPHLRKKYLHAMATLLIKPNGWMICKTFEYDISLSSTPPYSVTESDMHTLCDSLFKPTILQKSTRLVEAGTLHQRGAKEVTIATWKLSVIA